MDDPMDDWRRRNMKYFMNMDAAVLLPHLVCLTDHERDIILKRARFENCLDAMTCLLDDVHRRWKQSSYQQLLQALNHCEYKEIAQEMERELIRVNLSSESSGTYRSGNHDQTRNASKLSEPPSSQNAASIHHSMPEMAGGSGSQEQGQKEKVSYSRPDVAIVHPQSQTDGTAAVSVSKQNEGLSTGENVIPADSTGKTSPCSEIDAYPIGVKEEGMVESPSVASSKSENLKPRIKSETVAHTNVTHSENIDLGLTALDAPAVETNAREGGDMAVPEESDEKPGMLTSHAYSSFHFADLQISTMTNPGISERPDPECTVTRPNDDQMESLSAEQTRANSQTQDGNDSVNGKRQKIDALQGYQNWERDDDDNNFSGCDQSFDTAQNVSNFSGFGDLSYNDLAPAMKIKEPNEEKMQNIPNETKANGEELIRFSTGDEACKNMNSISEFYVSASSPEHKEDYQAQPGVGEGISKRQLTSSLTEDVQSQIPSEGEPVDNCCLVNQNVHNPRFSNLDSFSGHTPGDEKGSWLPCLIVAAMFCVALMFIKQRYKSS